MTDPAQEMSLSELYAGLGPEAKAEADASSKAFRISLAAWATFLGIAVLFPLVLSFLVPPGEGEGEWFQRSGSIMVVFALLAELRVNALHRMSDAGKMPFLHVHIYMQRKFQGWATSASYLTLLIVVAGTVIWGYGDLIHETWIDG